MVETSGRVVIGKIIPLSARSGESFCPRFPENTRSWARSYFSDARDREQPLSGDRVLYEDRADRAVLGGLLGEPRSRQRARDGVDRLVSLSPCRSERLLTPVPVALAVRGQKRKVAEVDLGLLAGLRLEAHRRLHGAPEPQRSDVVLQDGVAAGVALSAQLTQQHRTVFNTRREASLKDLDKNGPLGCDPERSLKGGS